MAKDREADSFSEVIAPVASLMVFDIARVEALESDFSLLPVFLSGTGKVQTWSHMSYELTCIIKNTFINKLWICSLPRNCRQ